MTASSLVKSVFSVPHTTPTLIFLSAKPTPLKAPVSACLRRVSAASGVHSTPKAQPFKPSYLATSQSSAALAQASRKAVRSPPKRPTLVTVVSSSASAAKAGSTVTQSST